MGTRKVGILLGVPIDRRSLTGGYGRCARRNQAKRWPQERLPVQTHTLLWWRILIHSFDPHLNCAATVVADGIGVTLTARLIGLGVGPRITGSDYFSLMRALQQCGTGGYFFRLVSAGS